MIDHYTLDLAIQRRYNPAEKFAEIAYYLMQAVSQVCAKELKGSALMDRVEQAVCDYYEIELGALQVKRRWHGLVLIRQTAMYLIRNMDKSIPYKVIGDRFGGYDHTSVIHACKSIQNLIDTNPEYKKEVEQLKRMI